MEKIDFVGIAKRVTTDLKKDGIEASAEKDIVALIAYLQRLGTDIRKQDTAPAVAVK